LIAGIFWTPVPIVAGFLALSVPALNLNVPAADMVGPLVAAELLGVGGAILVFIIVFSALASSLDSLLAATSDLVLTDIYKGHLFPGATEEQLANAARWVILTIGVITWLLCWPRLTTLAELLYLTGAFVASTIWPIAAGLYWQKTNPNGATFAMLSGTLIGLASYYLIGFYVAALISAAISMCLVLISTWIAPRNFDWSLLNQHTLNEIQVSK